MIRLGSRSSTGSLTRREWDIGVPQTADDLSGDGYSFVIQDHTLNIATPQFMVKYGGTDASVLPKIKDMYDSEFVPKSGGR